MFYSSQYELSFRNVISHDGCKGISQKIFVKVNTFKNAILLLEIHILQFKSPRFFQPQKKYNRLTFCWQKITIVGCWFYSCLSLAADQIQSMVSDYRVYTLSTSVMVVDIILPINLVDDILYLLLDQ